MYLLIFNVFLGFQVVALLFLINTVVDFDMFLCCGVFLQPGSTFNCCIADRFFSKLLYFNQIFKLIISIKTHKLIKCSYSAGESIAKCRQLRTELPFKLRQSVKNQIN